MVPERQWCNGLSAHLLSWQLGFDSYGPLNAAMEAFSKMESNRDVHLLFLGNKDNDSSTEKNWKDYFLSLIHSFPKSFQKGRKKNKQELTY